MNRLAHSAMILILLAVSLSVRGPALVQGLAPKPGVYLDFVQEWLSARSFWHSQPIYRPQLPALAEYTGIPAEQLRLRLTWNAHPPAAVLLALPFGLLHDYHDAHWAWSILSLFCVLLSSLLIITQLDTDRFLTCLLAMILLIWSYPLYVNLHYGQLGCQLLLMMTLAWWADRQNWPILAGLAAGLAISVKLFPGLLLVYFLAARRWAAFFSSVATVVVSGLACLMIFGPQDLRTYVQHVLPSLDEFRGEWINLSLAEALARIGMLLGWAELGRLGGMAARLFVLAALVWTCRRTAETWQRDRAFALTIASMLLLSPVVWTHYLILLTLPSALLLATTRSLHAWLIVVLLNLPLSIPASLLMTETHMDHLVDHPTYITAQGVLTLLPYQYGLISVFIGMANWRRTANPASSS